MINGVSMTQLKMVVLSEAASVDRVADLHVKPDDVVLKVPVQGGFGSFSLQVVGSKTILEPSTENKIAIGESN